MDTLTNEPVTMPQIDERLPWHKPQIQQLVVSLDTNLILKEGSFVDGELHDGSFPLP